MVTLLSLSVFSLAPLLHSSRFPLVRLLAALPMGALIFVAAWLVLQASRNIIYGGWGDDIPGAHEPFWEYGMIVLPAIASLLMMERAVKKGAREQLSDKAVSLASKQDQ